MLNSKATQFSLSPAGEILWQEKVNNPLPGISVAKLVKGEHPLCPAIEVISCDATDKHDANALKGSLNIWLNGHMQVTLEPLVLLGVVTGAAAADDPVAAIAAAVYNGLGIVSREEVEDVIAKLDTEKRAALRAKKIRLGPILVFIPALNKPAAVRLRALLWSLYNDAPLPSQVPADGIVSVRIDEALNPDPAFYRAIGYPLYGGRAVRIDMLDRVISSVYDNAKDGKFQARHEMAEWLGASIENLYKVLTDMGHTKVFDPAEEAAKAVEAEVKPEDVDAAVVAVEPVVTPETLSSEEQPAIEKSAAKKPELATFRLKRGKAFDRNTAGGGKKPQREFTKKDAAKKAPNASPSDQRGDKNTQKFKDKKHKDKKRDGKKPYDDSPRVISIEAKKRQEDSPFAILQQLKKSDG